MGWADNLVTGVIAAIVAAGATAITGVYIGGRWQEQAAYINPTCDSPKGLTQVPRAALEARDDVGKRPENDPHEPAKAIDGYTGSIWFPQPVPRSESQSSYVAYFGEDQSTLSIAFEGDTELRLICVNNGLGSGDVRYENWGKVRTLRVWGDDRSRESHDVALEALSTERSENLQVAGSDLGKVREVHFQVLNAHAGKSNVSHDPDVCRSVIDREASLDYPDEARDGESKQQFLDRLFKARYGSVEAQAQPRYDAGCLQSPTPRAGLSEVILYETNPNDPAPGWIPFRKQ